MTKFDQLKQEWHIFTKQAALTCLAFVLFGCAVGLLFGVLALFFGWVVLETTTDMLRHCGKLAALAVAGFASLYWIRLLRRKAARATTPSTTTPEQSSAPASPTAPAALQNKPIPSDQQQHTPAIFSTMALPISS